MAFRISDGNLFDASVRSIQRNHARLAELQIQVATGKRINSLADDPASASQVFDLRRGLARIAMFGRNIDAARARLDQSEAALAQLGGVLVRLRELAVSADVETDEFDQIQAEVEVLFDEVVALANTRSGGEFLFAGFENDATPFTVVGAFVPGGASPTVTYNGDAGVVLAQIGESSTTEVNVPGSALFRGDSNGDGSFPDAPRVDIFTVITAFRDRLQAQDSAGMLLTIGELDAAIDQVLVTRGAIGARSNRLEIAESQLSSVEVALKVERASLEEVDVIEAASELRSQEAVFQAALAVTARVLQPTLLDFLS
jgi:flagellar hook-associated protein 3 FlgL